MTGSLMVYTVNCGFSWFIVVLSIVGYIVTLKRARQKWPLWVVLASGWALIAALYTALVVGIPLGRPQLTAMWLSSYLLVMASLLLLFLKLTALMKNRGGR